MSRPPSWMVPEGTHGVRAAQIEKEWRERSRRSKRGITMAASAPALRLVESAPDLMDFGQPGAGSLHALAYHPGEGQRCPSCGGRQWTVGRTTAECAHCDTALPLAAATGRAGNDWKGD